MLSGFNDSPCLDSLCLYLHPVSVNRSEAWMRGSAWVRAHIRYPHRRPGKFGNVNIPVEFLVKISASFFQTYPYSQQYMPLRATKGSHVAIFLWFSVTQIL